MPNIVYFTSTQESDTKFAEALANHLGVQARQLRSLDEVEAVLDHPGDAIVLVEAPGTILDRVRFEEKLTPAHSARVHYIYPSSRDLALALAETSKVTNFLTRGWVSVETAAQLYSRVVRARAERSAVLDTQKGNPAHQTFRLSSSLQKNWAASGLHFHLVGYGYKKQLCTKIASAADELIMNAIFDAPVHEDGKPKYAVPSDAEFDLSGKDSVSLEFSQELPVFQLRVTDFYGSLETDRTLRHISKAFDQTSEDIIDGQARPGLGLATIFRSGASLLYITEKGVRTDAAVFFLVPSDENFQFVSVL